MTTPSSSHDLAHLTGAVTQLAEALARSERRTARLERIVRWGVLGTLGVTGAILTIIMTPFPYAVAQPGPNQPAPPSRSVEEALDRINQNLGVLGMMGEMMQAGFVAAVGDAMKEAGPVMGELGNRCPDPADAEEIRSDQYPLGAYVVSYFCQHKIPLEDPAPTPDNYQQALMAAAGGMVVNAGVLVARIRRDSDAVREYLADIGGTKPLLNGIRNELHLMNGALLSVPVMAAQMDLMNRHMSGMNYSMGSTMGRMGSWMPW